MAGPAGDDGFGKWRKWIVVGGEGEKKVSEERGLGAATGGGSIRAAEDGSPAHHERGRKE